MFGEVSAYFRLELVHIFAWKLVSRTSKQVSRNFGPLWQPGVYNDTNSSSPKAKRSPTHSNYIRTPPQNTWVHRRPGTPSVFSGTKPREASTLIFKIRSCAVRSDLINKHKISKKCLIFNRGRVNREVQTVNWEAGKKGLSRQVSRAASKRRINRELEAKKRRTNRELGRDSLSASKIPVFQFTVCTSWFARPWFKIHSYSARSDLKNKSARFSGKSAQRGSFGPDITVDIRPNTLVRPSFKECSLVLRGEQFWKCSGRQVFSHLQTWELPVVPKLGVGRNGCFGKLRNHQSTFGGPKRTKMDLSRPKWTKPDHFGLTKLKSGSE